jgi:uncharacterized protein YkwD
LSIDKIGAGAIDAFKNKLNEERQKVGLAPLAYLLTPHLSSQNPFEEPTPIPKTVPGTQSYTPPTPIPTATPIPTVYRPYIQNPPNVPARPTSKPAPIPFIPQPTATPIIYVVTATPTTAPPTQPTRQIFQPSPTPLPARIPTKAPSSTNTSQAEQDIFRLTNEQRAQNGVPPLTWSDNIASVARAHSQDMVDRNYFNHITPDGIDPFQRLTLGGVSYMAAAENIAAGPSADWTVNCWMTCPGEDKPQSHRANILNPAYHKVGVGVVASPQYGIMVTQDFTN